MGEHVVVPEPARPAVAAGAATTRSSTRWWRSRFVAAVDRAGAARRPGSSSCRSATRWCWPSSSRASTSSAGGRVVFGMGVGYVEPEMRAVGVPMEGRGARSDEYVAGDARAVGARRSPHSQGEHVRFDGVDAYPRPVQEPLPGDRGRTQRRRAPARGAERRRLVRLRARPRHHGGAGRVAATGGGGGGPRASTRSRSP